MRIVDKIIQALRGSAIYNPDVQEAPACILWPDRDHQWEAVIPRLQNELPELLLLGDYEPDKKIGPAIWLRCVIAGKNEDVVISGNTPPILYLPGVSRQDLRAVESCPEHLNAMGRPLLDNVDYIPKNSQGRQDQRDKEDIAQNSRLKEKE